MLGKLYVRECKNQLCKKIFKTYQKNQVYCCPSCRCSNYENAAQHSRRGYFKQLCENCQKAIGGCSWSICLVPVDGWKAKKITIKDTTGNFTSYRITYCPEFIQDRR